MKPANYAPVYAGLYPELAEIARKHGYAMAAHGSFARDADLICIPWIDDASDPQAVVDAITSEFVIRSVGEPSIREHGRIVYTLTVSAPGCFIDLSFTPRSAVPTTSPAKGGAEVEPLDTQQEAENLAAVIRYIRETPAIKFDPTHAVACIRLVEKRLRTSSPVGQQAKEGE